MNDTTNASGQEWTHDRIMAEVAKIEALGESQPKLARDPINQADRKSVV